MTKPEFIEQFVIAHYDDHDGSGMTDNSLAELIQRAGEVYDTIHYEPSPETVAKVKSVAHAANAAKMTTEDMAAFNDRLHELVMMHTPLKD